MSILLFSATDGTSGFELWRSDCEGNAPYRWIKVIEKGAYRGPENQSVATMAVFNGALYMGTGIQNGGYDRTNNIGPAGAEVIRVNADDTWDLIVGESRMTPVGRKEALSALQPGFGNMFNGYIWSMAEHDGWLYVGTMDSVIWVEWLDLARYPERTRKLVKDGSRYFGPYASASSVDESMNLIRRLFPFRTCTIDIHEGERALQRPCLLYHIKRCQAPCIQAIDAATYRADIAQIEAFLDGRQELFKAPGVEQVF